MFTLKHELEALFFIIIATGLSLFVITQRSYTTNKHVSAAPDVEVLSISPVPLSPSPLEVTNTDAPDGTQTLVMKKQQTKNSITYTFSTVNKSDNTEVSIFTKEETLPQTITVPFNTWSPDNVYLFLTESTSAINNYYLFSALGKPFSNGSQYLNIQELFSQKFTHYVLVDVTGWVASNLLILNTKNLDGTQGPSFWFDIPSESFIQLSTRFN